MTFVVVSLIAPQTFVPALAPFRIALLTGASAVVALVWEWFVRRRPLLVPSRETWIAAALAVWASLSVVFSLWPGGSVPLLVDFFKTLVAFWLLGTIVDTPARLRSVAWLLSVLAVPLALTGIKNFLGGVFMTDDAYFPVHRIRGYEAPLTDNPNDLALMLNLILPLTVALLLIERRRGARLLLIGMALISVLAVVLTFSRGGFLTLAITGVLFGRRLFARARLGLAIAVVVMALAATPFLPSSYLNRLGTITNIQADPTGSAQERLRDTVAAAHFALSHPILGAGFGMNALALNEERGAFWKAVHNVYLQLAVELGLAGLALYLLLMAGTLKSAGAVRRATAGDPASRDLFHLADGLHVAVIAFAVSAVFHPVAYHLYFFFIAGLAVALKAIYDAGPGARQDLVGATASGGPRIPAAKHARRRPGSFRPR
jgi:probable O-glycosylation ligase (exosortase A-associated)